MKEEDQRIAIAIACGWKSFPYCVINGVHRDIETWLSKEELEIGFTCDNMPSGTYAGIGVPRYLNDLHEIHKAIATLDKAKQYVYGQHLAEIVLGANDDFSNLSNDRDDFCYMFTDISQATAPQRAEAFLKTLNLWKE